MRIMIVSTSFGLDKSVGTNRMNSFARHLISFGCDGIVLTNANPHSMPEEYSKASFYFVEVKVYQGLPFEKNAAFRKNQTSYRNAFEQACNENDVDRTVISGFISIHSILPQRQKESTCQVLSTSGTRGFGIELMLANLSKSQ